MVSLRISAPPGIESEKRKEIAVEGRQPGGGGLVGLKACKTAIIAYW